MAYKFRVRVVDDNGLTRADLEAIANAARVAHLRADNARLRLLTAALMVQIAELHKPVAPFEQVPGAWVATVDRQIEDIHWGWVTIKAGESYKGEPWPGDEPLWRRTT